MASWVDEYHTNLHNSGDDDARRNSVEEPWKDLDETFADMLAKVVVAHVDVLGAGTKLWKPG
eukprot:scaffold2509_cov103-Alexandrium_tamarense.AAC.1